MPDQQAFRGLHVALQVGWHDPRGTRSNEYIRRRVAARLRQDALLELDLLGNVFLDEIGLARHGSQISRE